MVIRMNERLRSKNNWGSVALLLIFVFLERGVCAAQEPSPQASITVAQILSRMTANTAGLTSYKVPIHIDAHVKKGPVSVPVPMDGERYFKAPDSMAVKVNSGVPDVAKAFSNTYASLGTPLTWVKTYDITYDSTGNVDGHSVYTLRATYKKPSHVDHILLDVDTATADPIQARWFYTNGATIVMHLQHTVVSGQYRLPSRESLDVHFPEYSGTAVVTYGTYATNIPLDPSVFAK